MSETAERIWAARGMYTVQPDNRWPSPEPYIRLDLHEAEVAKLRAERDDTKSQADAVVAAWAETSQQNYQRAKRAEADLAALRKAADALADAIMKTPNAPQRHYLAAALAAYRTAKEPK